MDALSELTKNIVTVEDLNLILADVTQAESFSYTSKAKYLSRALKGKVSSVFEETLEKLELIGKIPSSADDRAAYFSKLKARLGRLPKMEIELAFSPSENFTKRIAKIIQENTNSEVILDINVKPTILAGATFGYRGQFRDYSFSAKLTEVLKQKYAKGLHEEF